MKGSTSESLIWRYLRSGYYTLRRIYYFGLEALYRIKLTLVFTDFKFLYIPTLAIYKYLLEHDYFDKFINREFSRFLLDEDGNIIKSLKTLRSSIIYKPVKDWVLPQLTFVNRQGDCKSTALLIGYYLAWLKIPFEIYTQFNFEHIQSGHSYLVFYLGEKTYFIDNEKGPVEYNMSNINSSNLIGIFSHVPR